MRMDDLGYYYLGLAIVAQAVRDALSVRRDLREPAREWLESNPDFMALLGIRPEKLFRRLAAVQKAQAETRRRRGQYPYTW